MFRPLLRQRLCAAKRYRSRNASPRGKIAESLGYCTNNLAIYLRNGSIKALGVVMPDSFNPYNALVLQGVEEKAKELGYNVIIGNTNCDRALERDLLKSFVSMKVSGILAIPSWLETTRRSRSR